MPQDPAPQEPVPVEESQSQVLSNLRLENQLLRSEVASLNQEMASVIQRAKDSQEGKNNHATTNTKEFEILISYVLSFC